MSTGSMTANCWCGHDDDAHKHYRPGTSCSECRCTEYHSDQPHPVWKRAAVALVAVLAVATATVWWWAVAEAVL